MNWPSYAEYRDSGVAWLGQVPSHWEVRQSRRLFSQRQDRARPGDEQLTASQKYGVIPQKEFMEREGANVTRVLLNPEILKRVESGDFVISMRSFQGGIEFSPYAGCVSSAYVSLIPSGSVVSGFFRYLLKSKGYISALQSTSNLVRDGQALRYENFTMVPLPMCPYPEQVAIAEFLDAETAKIDALIVKQQQLIATLREDRTATITRAVTKGLDSGVEMSDAGVWLGSSPRHWTCARMRDIITTIESGVSVNGAEVPAEPDQVGVLKTSCVTGGQGLFRPDANKTVHIEEVSRVACPVRAGTIIVNRANTADLVGSAGYVSHDIPNLYLSDLLWAVTVHSVEPQFLHLWMQTPVYRTQIAAWRSGFNASMQKLAKSSLRAFVLTLPPPDEQREIVASTSRSTAKLDRLICKASEVIDTLREYRSALITEAVTGKIDVRKAVA